MWSIQRLYFDYDWDFSTCEKTKTRLNLRLIRRIECTKLDTPVNDDWVSGGAFDISGLVRRGCARPAVDAWLALVLVGRINWVEPEHVDLVVISVRKYEYHVLVEDPPKYRERVFVVKIASVTKLPRMLPFELSMSLLF
jgi:hypothetical protein